MRSLLGWAVLLFFLFFLATEPVSAAHVMTSLFHGLTSAAGSLARFLKSA